MTYPRKQITYHWSKLNQWNHWVSTILSQFYDTQWRVQLFDRESRGFLIKFLWVLQSSSCESSPNSCLPFWKWPFGDGVYIPTCITAILVQPEQLIILALHMSLHETIRQNQHNETSTCACCECIVIEPRRPQGPMSLTGDSQGAFPMRRPISWAADLQRRSWDLQRRSWDLHRHWESPRFLAHAGWWSIRKPRIRGDSQRPFF